jgi:hypothetical protein
MVDGLQVWASCLNEKDNGPFGVMFKWMPGKYAVTHLEHITRDEGYTYQQADNCRLEDNGAEKRLGVTETDPEKLKALQRIWTTYQQALSVKKPS